MPDFQVPPPVAARPRAGAVSRPADAGKMGRHQASAAPSQPPRNLKSQLNEGAKRLFGRFLNVVSPRGTRTEAIRNQCIEDIQHDVGSLLADIGTRRPPRALWDPRNSRYPKSVNYPATIKESVAHLSRTMQPLTSRGEDGKQLFGDAVKASLRGMTVDGILGLQGCIESLQDDIKKAHEEIEAAGIKGQELGETLGDRRNVVADRRHFVAVALRDIQAQIKIELDRLMQFDPALTQDRARAATVDAVIAKLDLAQSELAAERAAAVPPGKRIGLRAGATAGLLGPLRDDLPPPPLQRSKASETSSSMKTEAASTPQSIETRMATRAGKNGVEPLQASETNQAATRAAARLLKLLAAEGKKPDILDAKSQYSAMQRVMRKATIPGSSVRRAFSASVMVSLQSMKPEVIQSLSRNIDSYGATTGYVFMDNAFADIRLQINAALKRTDPSS